MIFISSYRNVSHTKLSLNHHTKQTKKIMLKTLPHHNWFGRTLSRISREHNELHILSANQLGNATRTKKKLHKNTIKYISYVYMLRVVWARQRACELRCVGTRELKLFICICCIWSQSRNIHNEFFDHRTQPFLNNGN